MQKNAKERLLREELERIIGFVDNPKKLKISYGVKLVEKIIHYQYLI